VEVAVAVALKVQLLAEMATLEQMHEVVVIMEEMALGQ
jgi:hypothetical protein